MNAVISDVLVSIIANDHCGECTLLLENMHACPELFTILFEEVNLIGGTTYKNSKIYFPVNGERLTLQKVAERGTYRRL